MQTTFEISQTFFDTLKDYKASYHKEISWGKVVNRAMSYWVSFAMAKTIQSDPAKMAAYYRRQATNATRVRSNGKMIRRNKSSDEWKGTLASKIAFATNYRGIRSLKGAAAYKMVRTFYNRHLNSIGFHKFGYVPALKRLKSAGSSSALQGASRRMKHFPPGTVTAAQEDDANPFVEVTNFARGIVEQSPDAFAASEQEVINMIKEFTEKNLAASFERFRK